MSSNETARLSGAGHLLSFYGTDSLSTLGWIDRYYGGDYVAGSVPATEHSVMCAGTATIGEKDLFSRILDLYPNGIVSVVSDTFDLWAVLTEFMVDLKDKIMKRDGKLVVRPDCYDEKTEILTQEGWVYFKDLKPHHLVAQVNDNGEREFVKPLKYVKSWYEGDMIHFKNHHKTVDLLVTPNHRMMYYNKKNQETVKEAQKRYGSAHFFKRSAPAKPQGIALTFLERLMIAFQADGIYRKNKKGEINARTIRFSFAKNRKIERLR